MAAKRKSPKRTELETDLAGHVARLKQLQNPEWLEKHQRDKKIAAAVIPSYKKIIKSLKDELK